MEKDDANFELFSKILKGVFKFDLKKVDKKEFDKFLSKYDHGLTLKIPSEYETIYEDNGKVVAKIVHYYYILEDDK